MSPARSRPAGFTLVELLVVIAIVGILSSFLVAGIHAACVKAYEAHARTFVANAQTAIAAYREDVGYYPGATDDPTRPPVDQGTFVYLDPWRRPYHYVEYDSREVGLRERPASVGGGQPWSSEYEIFSSGVDGIVGTGDDIGNW